MKKSPSSRGSSRRIGWNVFGQIQTWAVASVAALLLAVPTIRMSESSEIDTAKVLVEEVSFVTRSVSLQRPPHHVLRERVADTRHPFQIGHILQHKLFLFAGHRLSNGLMAPMTC
jgi:hypothetical protein